MPTIISRSRSIVCGGKREEKRGGEKRRDNSFGANNVRAVQTEIQTNSNCPINFQLGMKYADDSCGVDWYD